MCCMKRFIILSGLLLISISVFSQKKIIRDPSYSVRNYKHANKVVYARQQRLEKTVVLGQTVVVSNSEYKHRHNHAGLVVKSTVRTNRVKSSSRGSKHPLTF